MNNIKGLFTHSAIAISLACASSHSIGQAKTPPSIVAPVGSISAYAAEALSAPALDGASALDVEIPSVYVPIEPCRIADTRQIKMPFGGNGLQGQDGETVGFWAWAGDGCDTDGANQPLPVGQRCYEPFGGSATTCNIPSDATAVHVNFTVPGPKGNGYLRVWPFGAGEPEATIFAWRQGFGMTNAGTVPICSDGTTDNNFDTECVDGLSNIIDIYVKIYSDVAENLVIDAFGYYRAP